LQHEIEPAAPDEETGHYLSAAAVDGTRGFESGMALDFMHDTLYDARKFRLLNVIDEGNREALRIGWGSSIPSTRLLRLLDELIDFYGKPKAIRMDNGPEMTSAKFVSRVERYGIALRFIQPGKLNQNAFVERFNRSVRQEMLNVWLFDSLAQAQQILERWRI
jgi:putative transposase